MGKTRVTRALAAVLAVAAAGCAGAVEPSPPSQAAVPTMQSLEAVTAAVLADAVERTGIDRALLQVESALAVTWPDGSLGCPEPGMNYTMALVPGYRIRVRAGEALLDYHASRRGFFTLCPAGRAVEPGVDPTQ